MAALKQEAKKKESPPKQPTEQREELSEEPQEQPEKPEEAQPPGESIPEIALLKLLKAMQEGYLARTEFIERFREPNGKLPEPMEAELAELAHDQIELAGHARKLLAKFQQQPEQKPENEPAKQPEEKPKEKEIDPSKIDL